MVVENIVRIMVVVLVMLGLAVAKVNLEEIGMAIW
jgi:hypothetical protein